MAGSAQGNWNRVSLPFLVASNGAKMAKLSHEKEEGQGHRPHPS